MYIRKSICDKIRYNIKYTQNVIYYLPQFYGTCVCVCVCVCVYMCMCGSTIDVVYQDGKINMNNPSKTKRIS